MGELVDSVDNTELTDPSEVAPSSVVARMHSSATGFAIAVGTLVVITLTALAGWLGYQTYDDWRVSLLRAEFVEAARQGAMNLTTIDVATVDTDVQRILDSSTGSFRDDFQKRAEPFVEVVRKAQSKSVGTVTTAALESYDGDRARVLVTVSMTMANPDAPEQPAQGWRMRIGVQKSDDTVKVSDVQFVT